MNYKNAISTSNNEVQIKLRVIPGSSNSVFPAGYNQWRGCIEIKVKSMPQDNKANNEVIDKIASYFDILPKDMAVIHGQKSREKIVSIKNIPIKDVCKKIRESLCEL
ncbi:MAG: DUF167 domain-containing protein [Petrotogales bacterium]